MIQISFQIVPAGDKEIYGKTGLIRNYYKSPFSTKTQAKNSFEKVIQNINAKYILVSYNNEGILSEDELFQILQKKGHVTPYQQEYKKFKSNKRSQQSNSKSSMGKTKAVDIIEFLFFVQCYTSQPTSNNLNSENVLSNEQADPVDTDSESESESESVGKKKGQTNETLGMTLEKVFCGLTDLTPSDNYFDSRFCKDLEEKLVPSIQEFISRFKTIYNVEFTNFVGHKQTDVDFELTSKDGSIAEGNLLSKDTLSSTLQDVDSQSCSENQVKIKQENQCSTLSLSIKSNKSFSGFLLLVPRLQSK